MMSGDDDGVTPDGGGGSGSGSGMGNSGALYPMAVGDSWTFSVAAVGAGSICAAGSHEQHVMSANAVGGRAAFQLTNFCTGVTGTYDYAVNGDNEVDFYYQGSWLTLVDPNLTEGHMWPYFNTSYHWHRETSVTVPAGTYDDCWTAEQDVSYTAYLTYCRGVGLVRSYSSDLTGSGWDAKLASSSL
jgi:hypothetical protein